MDAYKSIESPNFGFVLKRDALEPYSKIIESIKKRYIVTDFTEFNFDSGYSWSIKDASGEIMGLSISLVGKYAYLLGVGKDIRFVLNAGDCVSESESFVLSTLQAEGIKMLSLSDLEQRLPIRLRDELDLDFCGGESDLVFHWLFSRSRISDHI